MSQLPPERVYTGFWVDHAYGTVLGSTLTASPVTANAVVALLSILITFAGSHLWDIIAFISFSFHATNSAREGLHHQEQIMLRNVGSPAAFFFKVVKMTWHWRRCAVKKTGLSRLTLLALIAALCGTGFLVAGVLSSLIVSNSNIEVLAHHAECGFENKLASIINSSAGPFSGSYFNQAVQESVRYTHECYQGSTSNPACQIYTTQSIEFNTSYETCPFRDVCALKTNPTLVMDTGLMWSHGTFGVNMPLSHALAMRKVTKCAPLDVTQYQKSRDLDVTFAEGAIGREPFPGEQLISWYLGSWVSPAQNATFYSTTATLNISENYAFEQAWWHYNSLERFQNTSWAHGVTMEPIDVFHDIQGDLTLSAIYANRIEYPDMVEDPVFAAHVPRVHLISNGETSRNKTFYVSDRPAGMIGCTEQYQFCTPAGQCTDLTYSIAATQQATSLTLNPQQNVTLYLFANALINYSANLELLNRADGVPLKAKDGMQSMEQHALKWNQWEDEVKYWKASVLALLQKLITDYAAGQGTSDSKFDGLPKEPLGPFEPLLCHSLKMKAPNGFSNINVLGMSFTIGLCGFIILINFGLARMLRWLSKMFGKRWVFNEQWEEEELLQFHRTAYESNGVGNWFGDLHTVPGTLDGTRFKTLADEVSNQARTSITSNAVSTLGKFKESGVTIAPDAQGRSGAHEPKRSGTW